MCGVLGIVIKDRGRYKNREVEKLSKVLFKFSQSRGKEASGLAVKNGERVTILRQPLAASDFLKTGAYARFSRRTFYKNPVQNDFFALIGHTRLATHGSEFSSANNQPVVKHGVVCAHNGIITNDKALWKNFPDLEKESDLDTEVFVTLLNSFLKESQSLVYALRKLFQIIEGSASVGLFFDSNYSLVLATNTGSMYFVQNDSQDIFVFASEKYILEKFVKKAKKIAPFGVSQIKQLLPQEAMVLDVRSLAKSSFDLTGDKETNTPIIPHTQVEIEDYAQNTPSSQITVVRGDGGISPQTRREMEERWSHVYQSGKLRRCTKCLLPETMTFIDFDEEGVCNYCRAHKKIQPKGAATLEEVLAKYRRHDGKPDCLLAFSGGRDSSFGLHYLKKEAGMHPITFTYDWGMMTDLGRRNEARLCAKLGVEHIIISADIRTKRKNIRQNLLAWLRRPELGMIPILMAGDKDLIYYIKVIKKQTGINLLIDCFGEGLEDDLFKIGLTGVKMDLLHPYQELPLWNKAKISRYYLRQCLQNPAYINSSLLDTFKGFLCAFFLPCDSLHLFNYLKWDEEEILSTIDKYDWERETDTKATWRIDDGTACFYNYIYMVGLGLNEFDTFRSVQVREGHLSRDKALSLLKEESKPRYASLEWYARTIGFDINKAMKVINSMPRRY